MGVCTHVLSQSWDGWPWEEEVNQRVQVDSGSWAHTAAHSPALGQGSEEHRTILSLSGESKCYTQRSLSGRRAGQRLSSLGPDNTMHFQSKEQGSFGNLDKNETPRDEEIPIAQ